MPPKERFPRFTTDSKLPRTTSFVCKLLTLIICPESPPKILNKGIKYYTSKLYTLIPLPPFLSIKSGIKTTPSNRPQCFKVPKIRCNSCKIPLEAAEPPLLRQAPLKIIILIFFINKIILFFDLNPSKSNSLSPYSYQDLSLSFCPFLAHFAPRVARRITPWHHVG